MEVTVTVFDITALMAFTVSTSLFISVLRSSYTTPPRNAANEKKKRRKTSHLKKTNFRTSSRLHSTVNMHMHMHESEIQYLFQIGKIHIKFSRNVTVTFY